MLESGFQRKAIKWLESQGAYCRKQNASGMARTGTPDYLVCFDTLFMAIEFKKSNKDKPTPLQKYNIDIINTTGGVAIVLRPETFSTFKQIVEQYAGRIFNFEDLKYLKRELIMKVGVR